MTELFVFVDNHGLGQQGDHYAGASNQQVLDHPAAQREMRWRDQYIREAHKYRQEVERSRVWVLRCLVKAALEQVRSLPRTRNWRPR
jgi:hypothetical protein